MNKQKSQSGSAHLVVIIIIVLAIVGTLGYVYYQNFLQKKTTSSQVNSKYTSVEDNFKINFPKTPKVTDLGESTNKDGVVSTGKTYDFGSNQDKKYSVMVFKTQNGAIADWNKLGSKGVQDGLLGSADIIVPNIPNSDSSDRCTTYQNRQALIVRAIKKTDENKKAFFISFFNKATNYIIYEGGVGVNEEEFMNFANSFEFIN